MPAPLWFLIGAATMLAVTQLVGAVRRRLRSDHRTAAPPPQAPTPLKDSEHVELELARRVLDETTRDLESLATGLGDDLATMASAIEGHAQLLCEAMGEPRLLVERGDHLWTSVRRLRMFSEKILSFSQVEPLPVKGIDVRSFLNGIAQEIEDTGNHTKVQVSTAEYLPLALANERALRNAALFLVDTLLRIDTRANRLELRALAQVFEDQATRVQIEISAEADEAGPPHEPTDHALHLGYVAARNLLQAQDAQLSFDEIEGLSVACFISIATTETLTLPPEPERDPAEDVVHQFGGVLILESDPEIRSLISHELRPLGRNMISCVDGASARSLLEATPERFELAILDADARVESGESIARLASEHIPGIRILLLTTRPISIDDLVECSEVQVITKPFGVPEIREALYDLLETTPASQAES